MILFTQIFPPKFSKKLTFFYIFNYPETFPGVMGVAIKFVGPIGSAVMTFIGYRQTDEESIYIDIFI